MKQSGISRGEGPQRKAGLRRQSAKRAAEQRERRKRALSAFGAQPACAVQWDGRCRGWADALHELRKASQGGSRLDPGNLIAACNPCNGAIEDNPLEAHRRGFVIRAEDTE